MLTCIINNYAWNSLHFFTQMNFVKIYLFIWKTWGRGREKEREIDWEIENLPSSGSFSIWPQCLWLGQTESRTKSFFQVPHIGSRGPSAQVTFTAILMSSAGSCTASKTFSTQFRIHIGCWYHRQRFHTRCQDLESFLKYPYTNCIYTARTGLYKISYNCNRLYIKVSWILFLYNYMELKLTPRWSCGCRC